ncbi:MAG TPA: pyridoxamine 5'-phosphate oxidase [Bacteroidia bacterium]|nr:pyridoxamine 5'-phosphate oxidase [Bacteroidia bacterium]
MAPRSNFIAMEKDINEYLKKMRHDFSVMKLDETMVDKDPFDQFGSWFVAAVEAKVNEPNAMVLSTVSESGRPSSRVMLLRHFSGKGFSFFTNYNSRKGKEIEKNPAAAILFFWPELERQVRIEGKLSKVSAAESDDYFLSRPRESRIGAWASPQSEMISGRKALEDFLGNMKDKFADAEVIRPEWWGGFNLVPDRIEFWQGRPSRLHDRICYVRQDDGTWRISRLAP